MLYELVVGLGLLAFIVISVCFRVFLNEENKWRKRIEWLWLDFSGARYIWEKIKPPVDHPSNRKSRPTFFLWFIGIYVAFFSLASQRYENRVDTIVNSTNAIFTLLSTPKSKEALSRISMVQRMPCPCKPEMHKPHTVVHSFFSQDKEYEETVELLKKTIEDWRDSLASVNLKSCNLKQADLKGAELQECILKAANLQEADLEAANLQKADLREANLQEADLWEANIQEADIRWADLQKAILKCAKLQEANLWGANLQKADLKAANLQKADLRRASLQEANLRKSDLKGAKLQEADFTGANLQEVENLTIEQLSEVKSLYRVIGLNPKLKEQIEEKHGHLLAKPDEENNSNKW